MKSFDNLKSQLKEKELNPKQVCDWSNPEEVEQTRISLKELQLALEGEMSHAIESHMLGKERTLNILKESLPMLEREKVREKELDPELSNLITIVESKNKIDYCLGKLHSILHTTHE